MSSKPPMELMSFTRRGLIIEAYNEGFTRRNSSMLLCVVLGKMRTKKKKRKGKKEKGRREEKGRKEKKERNLRNFHSK